MEPPANVLHFDTPFLTDIAHNADPGCTDPTDPASCKHADFNNTVDPSLPVRTDGFYDDELLNVHAIAGDGRVNENIALTTVHQMFHSEHNRLVDNIKGVLLADTSATGVELSAVGLG